MLEAELKASLADLSTEAARDRALALGFVPEDEVRERDIYWNGIDRDFRRTDEALRLRSVQRPGGDEESLLTYKGPKLDQVSNARTEHETAVSDGETAKKLLEALGFRPAAVVEKVRRTYRLEDVKLCLDAVAELGDFLELEIVAPSEDCRAAAVERLLELMDRLEIPRERLCRRSYLELLMLRQGNPSCPQ